MMKMTTLMAMEMMTFQFGQLFIDEALLLALIFI